MFPLSHMASLFPYILLAAFYIMLVVRSAEAEHEEVAHAEETAAKEIIYSQSANNQIKASQQDTYYNAFKAIFGNDCLHSHAPPTGTVNEGYKKVTLHKIILYTGPMRAPPFGFIA